MRESRNKLSIQSGVPCNIRNISMVKYILNNGAGGPCDGQRRLRWYLVLLFSSGKCGLLSVSLDSAFESS